MLFNHGRVGAQSVLVVLSRAQLLGVGVAQSLELAAEVGVGGGHCSLALVRFGLEEVVAEDEKTVELLQLLDALFPVVDAQLDGLLCPLMVVVLLEQVAFQVVDDLTL